MWSCLSPRTRLKNLSFEELGEKLSDLYESWEQAVLDGETTDDGTYAVISFFGDDNRGSIGFGLHIKPLLGLKEEQTKPEEPSRVADVDVMEE